MRKLKDSLYNWVVRKNQFVRYEYERYVIEHIQEHSKHRFAHWKILCRLLMHYRVKKNTTPLLYTTNKVISKKSKENSPASKPVAKYLPYLDGAESRSYRYVSPLNMVKQLLEYDVISFDVFDTLIFRPFSKPRDLFVLIGGELDIFSFENLRGEAEDKLKERLRASGLSAEITLNDIYDELNRVTGIDRQKGMNTEFGMELKYCYANPYMKYVFDALLANDKRIVLTTDMYLNEEQIGMILAKCGYAGYEKMFVSCDYKVSKRSGELFNCVLEYIGNDVSLVHVGDNQISDVQMANEKGIATVYYENVNQSGNKYRAIDMSLVIGKAYAGIVNEHLHNGYKRYDAYYEYGYIYGGLFVMGYCNYIHELAVKNGIEKVLFVSRDGYIIKKVYEEMFPDEVTDYLFWSRIVGLKLCAYKFKNDFMKEYVYRWIKEKKVILFKEIFDNIELSALSGQFQKVTGLLLDECLTKENLPKFETYMNIIWEDALKIYDEKSIAAKKYFSEVVGESKKICIVDIGWRGQGALAIRSLVKEKWNMDCEVIGTVAASAPTKANACQLARGIINSYMFSPEHNYEFFRFHSKNAINNILAELLVGAPHPSIKSFELKNDDYELVFDVPEVANYPIIEAVHNGILEFVDDYMTHFGDTPYLYNITGHDAYSPIRHIFKDYKFIKRFLGKYEFQDYVGGTKGYRSRTIKNVFEKFNL